MIKAINITKSFGTTRALDGIDVSIPEGKTLSLIGPSGCGKSTLLRILIGLITPDGGQVVFNGEEMTANSLQQIRHNTGYVIQEGGLFPHLTARENLALLAEYLDWDRQRIDKRVHELAELTKIDPDILDRKPGALSGGQRQRISLMRALMLDPEVILLDEPLGSIDPLVRFELQTDLKQIFSDLNKTVVLVTHDLGEAAFLGDTIVLMQEGKIVQQGTVKEIIDHPANEFVRAFVNAQRSPLSEL